MKRSKRMTMVDLVAIEKDIRSRGLSLNAFFALSGINKSTWNRWQRGETRPNTGTLERAQQALEAHDKKEARKRKKT